MLLQLPRKSSLIAHKIYHNFIISAVLLCWFVWLFQGRTPTYSSEPKAKHSSYHLRQSMQDCCPNIWIRPVISLCFKCIMFEKFNTYFYSELLKYCSFEYSYFCLSLFIHIFYPLMYSTLLCIFCNFFRGMQIASC